MSAKAIYEVTGKSLLNSHLPKHLNEVYKHSFKRCRFVSVREESNLEEIVCQNPWLTSEKLVAKPDQLIKRRGKLGLIQANADLAGVRDWLSCNMGKTVQIDKAEGTLENFIIEPFVPHNQSDEYYVCIYSTREGETILFHDQGGIDIGNVEEKALSYDIEVDAKIDVQELESKLLVNLSTEKRSLFCDFILALHKVYNQLYFTYLEINPLVVVQDKIYVLDIAAKLDATAEYLCNQLWGEIIFPPPFGRKAYPEVICFLHGWNEF
jgi:ATP citrate (pro-S)-lyase